MTGLTDCSATVVCFGEIVWDLLPDGRRRLGGAPANVAYHLGRLGVAATLISRVGSDELGMQALEELGQAGMSTLGVQTDPTLPTGSASISVNPHGVVGYEIETPAAWDAIELTVSGYPRVVVFGTLSQRDPRSRASLQALAKRAFERVYDVNLRPPHTPIPTITESLRLATLVKMNQSEAEFLAAQLDISPEPAAFAREIMERYGPRIVCVTQGARGAWLASPGFLVQRPGVAAEVCDTVGSGDAFLATLVFGLLSTDDWGRTLQRANELGAWVASRPGAMPPA
jgi:fructokinase